MSRRHQRKNRQAQASVRFRLIPVWREQIDREALARVLLVLALHLDEKRRDAHKKSQQPGRSERGQS